MKRKVQSWMVVVLAVAASPAFPHQPQSICIPPLCVPDLPPLPVLGPVELPQLPTAPLPPVTPPPTVAAPPPGCSAFTVGMQVLILSANGQETTLPAIQEALDYTRCRTSPGSPPSNPGRSPRRRWPPGVT